MRRQKYIINRKSGSSQPILISMLDVKEDNPIRKLDYIYIYQEKLLS